MNKNNNKNILIIVNGGIAAYKSLELIRRYTKLNNLNIKLPSREEIIRCFENFYFGENPNNDNRYWTGYIQNEELLVDKKFFNELNKKNIIWGFVSGAERVSAEYILEKRLQLKKPPLVAMGDAPDKPDPRGFIELSKRLSEGKLGSSNTPIAYVGDTIADIKTIINARKEIPNQKFISIGVAPPHLHLKSRLKERNLYESNLKNAGADIIINSVNELKNIDLDFLQKI